jgi:putative ABC transport system ATP-binding protein
MILEVSQVSKSYHNSALPVEVLNNLDLYVARGESVAILGQSGSGKSTLLSLLAGLDSPTTGNITIAGQNLSMLSESQLAKFRARQIGIIFQQFHLMSHLNAAENVALPLELAHDPQANKKAEESLLQVGLGHRLHHYPYQLSGGECQRVAIARAIVVNPAILLADEPTGHLDNNTGQLVSDLIFKLVQEQNMTMLFVTHNEALAKKCQRVVRLHNGSFK